MKQWEEIKECGKDNCYANVTKTGQRIYCTKYPDGLWHCEKLILPTNDYLVHPKAFKTLKGAQRFMERIEQL